MVRAHDLYLELEYCRQQLRSRNPRIPRAEFLETLLHWR